MGRTDQRGDIPKPRVLQEPISWAADLAAVDAELSRVLGKWGPQSLTLFDWMSILGEEFGEVCKAVNVYEFGTRGEHTMEDVYAEAIQVAAVAVHLAAAVRSAS